MSNMAYGNEYMKCDHDGTLSTTTIVASAGDDDTTLGIVRGDGRRTVSVMDQTRTLYDVRLLKSTWIWTAYALCTGPMIVLGSLLILSLMERILHLPLVTTFTVNSTTVVAMVWFISRHATLYICKSFSHCANVVEIMVVLGTLGSVCSWLEELVLTNEQQRTGHVESFIQFLRRIADSISWMFWKTDVTSGQFSAAFLQNDDRPTNGIAALFP
jgi:hypothetical protein